MIAERAIHFAQRVIDAQLGYRWRYAIQVTLIDRMGFARMQGVGGGSGARG